jgi:hypothetical protein
MEVAFLHGDVRFAPKSDQIADIELGLLGARRRHGVSREPEANDIGFLIGKPTVPPDALCQCLSAAHSKDSVMRLLPRH